jgi:hypothetical protein
MTGYPPAELFEFDELFFTGGAFKVAKAAFDRRHDAR